MALLARRIGEVREVHSARRCAGALCAGGSCEHECLLALLCVIEPEHSTLCTVITAVAPLLGGANVERRRTPPASAPSMPRFVVRLLDAAGIDLQDAGPAWSARLAPVGFQNPLAI